MNRTAKIIFYTFVMITAISGLLFYLNPISFVPNSYPPNVQTFKESMTDKSPECPNYLKQEGTSILLYDLNQPASSTNPLVFNSLDDYHNYASQVSLEGIHCPVLDLQPEFLQSKIENNAIMPVSGEIVFNSGDYPTYDPNLDNEINYEFDSKPHEMKMGELSDNPMDDNWGGPQHSAESLASGIYEGDYVGKPLYFNMHAGAKEIIPGYPGYENPPPNYVPRDLIGDGIQMQHSKNL